MYSFNHSNSNNMKMCVFEFSEKISKEEFEEFKKDFDTLLKNQTPFYVIFNLLNIKNFDIKFFYKKMDYIYKNKNSVRKYLNASSIIINDSYGKLIKFGLKIKKPISPNKVCKDLESGISFLSDEFKKNNLEESKN